MTLLLGENGTRKDESAVPRIRILIAAGASAGHLYPALALAQRLSAAQPPADIAFVSSRRLDIERSIRSSGYRLYLVSIRPFRLPAVRFLRSAYYFLKSWIESFLIIEKFRPDLVVGFGSYVSLPVVLEAAFFKKPTLIHEQNVSLGLANRVLGLFAERVATSFRNTAAHCSKAVFTGYPLRGALKMESKEKARKFFNLGDKFTILVIGGSQGSHRINTEFSKAVSILEGNEDFQFIHISGKKDYSDLKKGYGCIRMSYCLFDFLDFMNFAYSLAELVICRCGAGTIAEAAFFKKAAILIPYPYALGHQLENARALEKEDAAIVIEEARLNPLRLSENIRMLMRSPGCRQALEENIHKFSTADADKRLAESALSLLN